MTWIVEKRDGRLFASFEGRLSAEEGQESARSFATALIGTPMSVVWDVRAMTDYDPAARVAWQEAVWPNRGHIASLTVIGARPLIKAGAMLLAVFIGAPWRFVESAEELERLEE